MGGLVHFSIFVAGMYGIARYKNVLQGYMTSLCINTIYWYSYAEIYLKKIISDYIPILDNKDKHRCRLYHIKDGKTVTMFDEPIHDQPIPFSEHMDALIYTTPTLDVVVLDNTVKIFDLDKIKSSIEFINVTVKFEDDPKHYDISLRTETSNFYVIGNHINKYIIWMMILNQHNVYRYGYNYTIQIIDHNVSISNAYNQDMNIVIQKEGFYVKQTECEITDLVCETTKSIDK